MGDDLAPDLQEAESEGVSAEELLGASATDPSAFAAARARERGMIPEPFSQDSARRTPRVLVAFTLLASIAMIVASLLLATGGAEGDLNASRDDQRSASSSGRAAGRPVTVRWNRPPSPGKRRRAGRVDPVVGRDRGARFCGVAVVESRTPKCSCRCSPPTGMISSGCY
jgi:hypothetical protein